MKIKSKIIFSSAFFSYILFSICIHRYQRGPKRQYNINLAGKIIIITGASAGIGLETARELAKYGATIIFACRNKLKTDPVIASIKQESKNNNLHFIQLQLDDYEDVLRFVKDFQASFNKVDILINNAGIASWKPQFNKNNHELVFATNHLGHFLLTYQLQNSFNPQSRIIYVSSVMHEYITSKVNFIEALKGKYLQSYNITKYCAVLTALKFQQILPNTKVVSLHPGVIRTELLNKAGSNYILQFLQRFIFALFSPMILSANEGAMTTVYTALLPYDELQAGGYYQRNQLSNHSKNIEKLNQMEELWQFSKQILDIQ